MAAGSSYFALLPPFSKILLISLYFSCLYAEMVNSELRLVCYCVGLYATFMLWGFLQERITSSKYVSSDLSDGALEWNYPVALNLAMAAATYFTASSIEFVRGEKNKVPLQVFWKPALSATLASPIGYEALKYISYPLMILTKSSKPVPVMVIGVIFYGRVYGWYKYVSVALLVWGISLFTAGKKSGTESSSEVDIKVVLFGMLLVLVNLAMDGYTNNEQDRLFSKYSASPNQMMKYVNVWQCVYQLWYLLAGWYLYGVGSELHLALHAVTHCQTLVWDILLFCLCASIGQVLIFNVMKEFGSLAWITISVTRKLFTIVLSVIMFQHKVGLTQWIGVGLVFVGLALDAVMSFLSKPKSTKAVKQE